ncbi:MAG: undecaprenyl/decaprenyl-phosphate alpha-N-acetylglucosaminyl 1-phosphate transferase [Acidobacteriaceae bacterium]|nr:undecaprenyl/decaprenyl-phosphate alpha-N-acetylglucosaminyl 1-phosphate transferase [Acidobacteriaceae bacterium]MBV9779061.1 undecaprenyl/decaprenyl-phosphate alpha-N-acetylglucosaminyl 1-phosphate transferase [Acidobacteriaceae bacterium]
MYSLLFLGAAAFVLSSLLTPLVCYVFGRLGIVDHPDNERKLHKRPIPRVGGIAIALSYALAFGCLLLTKLKGGNIVWDALPFAGKLFPAAGLVFVIGLLDDLLGLRPVCKLLGQVAAASVAYLAGIHVVAFRGQTFGHWWSLPVTVIWLVACMNAVNLIDGVDGVAAGVGLFATTTSLLAGLMQHNMELALATLPLAACLLGFLRYNFNPASIFLGDCGSLFIGFLLGCYGVLWSQKSATVLGMAAPLIAFAIPLLDTSLSIVRRFLRRQPIFGADRGHIHHRLLDLGLSPRKVALLLYGICTLAATFSLFMLNGHLEMLVLVVFCGVTWLGIQRLGYVEFDMAGRMLLQGSFRGLLNARLSIQAFEKSLTLAETHDDCWSVVKKAYKDFGFHYIEMQFAGRKYSDSSGEPDVFQAWHVDIPLSDGGHVHLAREFGPNLQHTAVAPFADALRSTLESKLNALPPIETPLPGDLQHLRTQTERWQVVSAAASPCRD